MSHPPQESPGFIPGEDVNYPPYDEEKLAELIVHVADRTRDDPGAGATTLNKLLYFADFAAMRELGRPITSAEYQKLPRGPAPRRLRPIRAQLIDAGAVELRFVRDALGYERHRLVALRSARLELFTADELRIVDEITDTFRNASAAQISELSHHEAAWQLVEDGDTIPYELAFLVAPSDIPATDRRKAEGHQIAQMYAGRLA